MGKRYLHPGCQAIGFPFLRRSDIRWFFCGMCTSKRTVHVCVCVCAAPTVIYACCHLACTMSKGQECHLVPHGYLLKVIGYVTSGTRSQRIWAGDDRSATLPEQLCSLSSVKKLIQIYVPPHAHHSISTQNEDVYVGETDLIKLLCCVFSFLTKSMQF